MALYQSAPAIAEYSGWRPPIAPAAWMAPREAGYYGSTGYGYNAHTYYGPGLPPDTPASTATVQ